MAKWLIVSDVVRMLHVPEATVYRWIRQGDIPCIERRGKHFFNQSTLLTWADSKHIHLKESSLVEQKSESMGDPPYSILGNAIKAGNVFKNFPSKSVHNLFKEIPIQMHLPKNIKNILSEQLLKRELLSSTGIGNGVAIPHPKYLIGEKISQSMIGTFFLETPLDFKAPDKMPVFVVFVLLSTNSFYHIELLSQLTSFLNHSETSDFLKQSPSLENLVDQLQKTLAETF